MAKKKIKKPVGKRTKQNKSVKTPRKPRTKTVDVVTTTEPAVETLSVPVVNESVPEILHVETVKIDYPSRLDYLDEQTVPQQSKIKQLCGDFSKWMDEATEQSFEKLKDFAFDYPLTFAISFCTVMCIIAIGVAAAMRYFRW